MTRGERTGVVGAWRACGLWAAEANILEIAVVRTSTRKEGKRSVRTQKLGTSASTQVGRIGERNCDLRVWMQLVELVACGRVGRWSVVWPVVWHASERGVFSYTALRTPDFFFFFERELGSSFGNRDKTRRLQMTTLPRFNGQRKTIIVWPAITYGKKSPLIRLLGTGSRPARSASTLNGTSTSSFASPVPARVCALVQARGQRKHLFVWHWM
ncbi:hypothetical protein V8E36_003840 [Tilletia maclaganii]